METKINNFEPSSETADYIISLIGDNISPHFLPVIIFLVPGLTSFATGTSWGTMAILMPIVIPLSHSVSGLYGLDAIESTLILQGVISSVLAGCEFGRSLLTNFRYNNSKFYGFRMQSY